MEVVVGSGTEPAEPAPTAIDEMLAPELEPARLRRLPRLLGDAVALLWTAAPGYFLRSLATQVVVGVAAGVPLLVLGRLMADLSAGAPKAHEALGPVVVLVVVGVVSAVAPLVLNYDQLVLGHRLEMHVARRVGEVAAAVDLELFDVAAFHDRLHRAGLAGMPAFAVASGAL